MPSESDLNFKDLALEYNWATLEQVNECLESQSNYENAGIEKPLSTIMLEKGYLTLKQISAIHHIQGKKDEYFVRGYTSLETLGKGGLGIVYKAKQDSMGRIVALKVMYKHLTSNDEYLQRFMREAKVSAQLQHPNIVRGIDCGESEGVYFFAMEYVDGKSVRDHLKDSGKFSEEETIRIILEVAQALQYAEPFGLVHRDIKPENIMLTKERMAKLCDLGLAKTSNSDMSLTQTGMVVGTPYYISPEQALGNPNLDIRSDIYSLGVTMFHMLTNSLPFRGDSAVNIISQHITGPIPSPKEANPDLSDGICAIINKMMAKKCEDRYQNSAELITDLETVRGGNLPRLANQGNALDQTAALPSSDEDLQDITHAATINIQEEEITREMAKVKLEEEAPSSLDIPQTDNLGVTPAKSEDIVDQLEKKVNETSLRTQRRRSFSFVYFLFFVLLLAGGLVYRPQVMNLVESFTKKNDGPETLRDNIPLYIKHENAKAAETTFKKQLDAIQELSSSWEDKIDGMVLLPDGAFTMGDSLSKNDNPVREEKVTSFYLDVKEVSNRQYKEFCDTNKYTYPKHWPEDGIATEQLDYPVVGISFYDALLYAKWCGKRLPSEVEWEFAIRRHNNQDYPWGNRYRPGKANIEGKSLQNVSTHPQGKTKDGILNLIGNAWEWTASYYGNHDNEIIPDKDTPNAVIRGGSYKSKQNITASYRDGFYAHAWRQDIGFRCALTPKTE